MRKLPKFTVTLRKEGLRDLLVKEFVTRGYFDYGEEKEEAEMSLNYDVKIEGDSVTLFPIDNLG